MKKRDYFQICLTEAKKVKLFFICFGKCIKYSYKKYELEGY